MKTLLLIVALLIVAIGGSLLWITTEGRKEEGAVTLRVINQPRWRENMERAVSQWNAEHPEKRVILDQLIIGYPQLKNKLITSAGAGLPPDISLLDSVWLAEFAASGQLAALDELDPEWFNEVYRKDFFPPFQRGDMYKGHLWGVRNQTDITLLWYRRDWLSREGLSPPETWDEVLWVGKHFQKREVMKRYGGSRYPLALPLGVKARETLVYMLLPLFWSNGGGVFEDGNLILDSEPNIETLTFLRDLTHKHRIVSPEAITFEWNRPAKLFAAGKAVMAFGGSYEKIIIQEITKWDDREFMEHVGYSLIPSSPRGKPTSTAGGMCYVVYEKSPHKRLALEIIELATNRENMKEFVVKSSQLAPRISVAESLDPESYPFLVDSSKYLYRARTRPNFPEYSRLSDLIQEMIEQTVTGEATPEAAVRETSKKILSLMNRKH